MNKQTIEIIVQFLDRIDLKGSEVPLYTQVMEELKEEYNKYLPKEPEKPKVNVPKKKEDPIEFEEDYEIQDEDQEDLEEPIAKPTKKIQEESIFASAKAKLKK